MLKRVFVSVSAVVLFCLTLTIITCGGEPPSVTSDAKTALDAPGVQNVFPAPHNCTSCHKFDEAKFKDLMGATTIMVVNYEMVNGLWQVLYEPSPGQRNVIYVSPKYDTVFYGQILGKNGRNFTREYMLAHAGKIETTSIPVRDAAFVMGNKEAKNKIFVFDDLECPYCARLHSELQLFLTEHKDFAVYVMLFPLPSHPKSEEKSKAVYCLGGLKERETAVEGFFKAILDNKKVDLPQEKKCDGSALDRVKQYGANTLKIKGTPVLVLPDGRVINGYLTKKELEDILSGKTAQKSASNDKGGQ